MYKCEFYTNRNDPHLFIMYRPLAPIEKSINSNSSTLITNSTIINRGRRNTTMLNYYQRWWRTEMVLDWLHEMRWDSAIFQLRFDNCKVYFGEVVSKCWYLKVVFSNCHIWKCCVGRSGFKGHYESTSMLMIHSKNSPVMRHVVEADLS